MPISKVALFLTFATPAPLAAQIHHYVFFGMDREKLPAASALFTTPAFEGAQITYPWRVLEPEKDKYDFSTVREDLALLTSRGKRLWIQLQDVSFSERNIHVPKYLIDDTAYHGGVARQYSTDKGRGAGWVARRWDPAVQERMHRLFDALGKEFDGRITGINLAESSVEFGPSDSLAPPGFTPLVYVDGLVANMRALKRAFPKSVALQYANFIPGEWRPTENRGYLDSVYAAARRLGVGVGGPDLMPHRPGQARGAHPLIRESRGIVPIGVAVQDGNLAEVNPMTGKPVTVEELVTYAATSLGVNYLFWGTEEPYFTRDVVPTIKKRRP